MAKITKRVGDTINLLGVMVHVGPAGTTVIQAAMIKADGTTRMVNSPGLSLPTTLDTAPKNYTFNLSWQILSSDASPSELALLITVFTQDPATGVLTQVGSTLVPGAIAIVQAAPLPSFTIPVDSIILT